MTGNVFLYVPNIIDYVRILCLGMSAYFMLSNPWVTLMFYWTSALLDEVDGYTARRLNQCSKFGGLLDVIVDCGISTVTLLCGLCYFYPRAMAFFQWTIILDVCSRWLITVSTAMVGGKCYKTADYSAFKLTQFNYNNMWYMNMVNYGTDMFFCMLYLINFTSGPQVAVGVGLYELLVYMTAPFALLSQINGLGVLAIACHHIVQIDESDLDNAKDI